jgi:hypothetical protein
MRAPSAPPAFCYCTAASRTPSSTLTSSTPMSAMTSIRSLALRASCCARSWTRGWVWRLCVAGTSTSSNPPAVPTVALTSASPARGAYPPPAYTRDLCAAGGGGGVFTGPMLHVSARGQALRGYREERESTWQSALELVRYFHLRIGEPLETL